MSCTNPLHADCPNCDGEILLKADGSPATDPIRITSTVKGKKVVETHDLSRHVLHPQMCPNPLLVKADLFELCIGYLEAGQNIPADKLKILSTFRRSELPEALGGFGGVVKG